MIIEFDSLSMLRDPLDLLGPKPMTQEQTDAITVLVKRMRELTAKMPPITLAAALPRTPTDPADLMFSFYTLSKEDQQLMIQRSKRRDASYLKSIPFFVKEIKDVQ